MDGFLHPALVPLFAAGREETLRPLLVQLVVIMLAARAGAVVARWLRQPSVVGEISAGLLLGPSAFGAVAPELSALVFPRGAAAVGGLEASLTAFSQVGLILLLFLIGIEFDFSHIRRQGRLAATVSVAGIVAPFCLGIGLAWLMVPRLGALGATTAIDSRSFALFMGTAMSITAIPILGRILIEMGLQHSPLGALVIAAAACDDAVGWTLLAAVSAIATGNFDPLTILGMAAATLALAAFMTLVLRPLLLPWLERCVGGAEGAQQHSAEGAQQHSAEGAQQHSANGAQQHSANGAQQHSANGAQQHSANGAQQHSANGAQQHSAEGTQQHSAEGMQEHGPGLPLGVLSVLLALLLVAALITSRIGIFAIFGAFLLGASLSGSPRVREAVAAQFSDFVTVFFLPIFFTFTGLRTNVGSLATPEAWGWAAAVFAVAVLGKWGGCGLAARLGGLPAGEASCVGVLMNTRALMELIVVNVGMDLGVIPPAVYCMLVFMAIGTTLMATPLAVRFLARSQYAGRLAERGFLRG
jgi:Kef-type K+ transport system membrane component KefB